jgi:TonB family protein
MNGRVEMSTSVQEPVSGQSNSRIMLIALIGPNEAHRKVVASALAGAPNRRFREFIDYPARLSEIPKILEQGFSVVMIDVDSDESYALKIVEGFAAAGEVMVMAYSQRNDPELVANCMRAGAREFLPLPGGGQSLTGPDAGQPAVAPMPAVPKPVAEPPNVPAARLTQAAAAATPESNSTIALPDRKAAEPAIHATLTPRPFEAAREEHVPVVQVPEPVWEAPEPVEAEPPALVADVPAISTKPVQESEPANEFEAWDTAHLRFTQAASTKQPDSRMRPTSPHELFARSRKAGEEEMSRPEGAASVRRPELLSRAPLAPELPTRNDRPRPEDVLRVPPPLESVPLRAPKEPPPLPPEMFLKRGADTSVPVEPESETGDIFDTPRRQVYKPTPQEMSFSSLAVEDNEEKSKHGGMVWAVVAASAGMFGCVAFLFFFMHPSQQAVPVPAAPVETQAAEAPKPAADQPDVFDKEFSTPDPAASATKPSAAVHDDGGAGAVSSGANQVSSQMMDAQLAAQAKLGANFKKPAPVEEAPPSGFTPGAIESGSAVPGAVFSAGTAKVIPTGAAISAGVAEGMLVHRTPPQYPSIAKTARVDGTVVLGATITKSGAISNLHVISGPGMLRDAAVSAVRTWRYRPYLLNNEPVDVDTTISVVFSLGK